jgi:hypothetical protein
VTPFSYVEYVVYLLRQKEAVLPQVFQPGDGKHEAEAVHGVVVLHPAFAIFSRVWGGCTSEKTAIYCRGKKNNWKNGFFSYKHEVLFFPEKGSIATAVRKVLISSLFGLNKKRFRS